MKIYLDFGHGGKDPGAVGTSYTKESTIALQIGLKLKSILEKGGLTIITTRTTDTYHSLDSRSQNANNNNCDYFISIHLNSFTNRSVKGCETWVYSTTSKTYNLAKEITANLSNALNTPNRGVKASKELSVLKNTNMPALLIEIDFLSNPTVEASCITNNYQEIAATTIATTLLKFIGVSSPNDKLYRVVIGAYKEKQNADKMRELAISKGFNNAYII